MEFGFKTDKGRMRSNNEDACFVMQKDKVFIIADGVGGNKSGEIASRTAVNGIVKYVEENPLTDVKSPAKIKSYFDDCIKDINFQVLESSQRFEENRGMATTIVVSYIVGNKMYVLNVGDSRAYIFRKNKLRQITEDHTYVNSLVKAGVITEEEAEVHENKNMITRAIGADYKVDADFFVTSIKKDDIILMCTDGLYGEVDEGELTEKLSEDRPMSDTCYDLIEMANRNGGNDNITIICLKITEEDIDE